jgi:hypothetical protein
MNKDQFSRFTAIRGRKCEIRANFSHFTIGGCPSPPDGYTVALDADGGKYLATRSTPEEAFDVACSAAEVGLGLTGREINAGTRVTVNGRRGRVERLFVMAGVAWATVSWHGDTGRPQLVDPSLLVHDGDDGKL